MIPCPASRIGHSVRAGRGFFKLGQPGGPEAGRHVWNARIRDPLGNLVAVALFALVAPLTLAHFSLSEPAALGAADRRPRARQAVSSARGFARGPRCTAGDRWSWR